MDKKKFIFLAIILLIITSISLVFGFKKNKSPSDIQIIRAKENIEENQVKNISDIEKVSENEKQNMVEENLDVTCFISGEVMENKVVTLPKGSRLNDAIELCGGLKDTADINRTNLSLKLEDEGHYIVPKIGEEIPEGVAINNSSSQKSSSGKININTADKTELMKITGIGEKTAEKIIDYREKNGKFKSIEDIKNVPTIGDKKFESMKDDISV